jgi:hypothetical protein
MSFINGGRAIVFQTKELNYGREPATTTKRITEVEAALPDMLEEKVNC